MNEGFVADASTGIAWAVLAQGSGATDGLRAEIEGGRPFVVPGLWMVEVANAMLVLMRRGRIEKRELSRALEALRLLRPEIDDQAPVLAFDRVSDLAIKHWLSVYDAAYLEIALRRGLPLATRDEGLRKAAARSRVPLLL